MPSIDRNITSAIPSFVTIDTDHFIDKAYAAAAPPGQSTASRATPRPACPRRASAHEGTSTTHFSIVDKDGNAVSLTYTLNDWFGAHVTRGGHRHPAQRRDGRFPAKPGAPNMYGLVEGPNNAIAPGKRPLSSMTPTIVTKDGKLVMVVGTPGGSRIPSAVIETISNIVDFGMTVTDAVERSARPSPVAARRDRLRAIRPERRHRSRGWRRWGTRSCRWNTATMSPRSWSARRQSAPSRSASRRLYGAIDPRLNLGDVEGY